MGCSCLAGFTIIFSLIVATSWIVLAVLGFMVRDCKIEVGFNNPAYLWKLVYFYNEECGLPEWWKTLQNELPQEVPVDLPEPKYSSTTNGVLLWYAISCSIRAVAALLALLTIFCTCGGFRKSAKIWLVFAWIWLATAYAGLIGDAVCSVIYGLQIRHTTTLEDLTGANVDLPSGIDKAFWALKLLPLLMMLFSARFFVFWIIEFVFVICCTVTLKHQYDKAKIEGAKLPPHEPWASQFTNAAGIDKNKSGNAAGRMEIVRRNPSDHSSLSHEPRSVSEYYAEPFGSPANATQHPQDITDSGGGRPGGAYMATPVTDVGPYRLQPPQDIYAQPWIGGRPSQAPPNPLARAPASSAPRSSNWGNEPPSPEGRLGEWDPRSPRPDSSPQSFFPATGYGQINKPQHQLQEQPLRPSALTSFQPLPPPGDASKDRGQERGRRDSREPRRYVQKLRDAEAEQLARQASLEARLRHQEDERYANERRQIDANLQEVQAKANAMEQSRKKRREAEALANGGSSTSEEEVRVRKPPPPPPPARRPRPEELQNHTPWSYVGPAISGPSALPLQNRRRGGDFDEDYNDDDYEERPNVPVPDYTLHIKRPNDRPALETH